MLFVLNLGLILYAVYGWLVPGMFNHPGLSWRRVVSAMSVEMTTGVFSELPQLALTLMKQGTAADTVRAMAASLAEDFNGDRVSIVLLQPIAGLEESEWLQVVPADNDWSTLGLILARNEVDYRMPVRLHDTIEAEAWCSAVGSKSFDLSYRIHRIGDTPVVCAEGRSVLVCFDYTVQRSIAIPEPWRDALTALVRP